MRSGGHVGLCTQLAMAVSMTAAAGMRCIVCCICFLCVGLLCGLGYVQGGRRWRRDTCGFIFGSWCFARATHSGSHTGPDNPRKHYSHYIRAHSGWSRRHWEPLAKLGQTRAQHSMTTTPPRFVIGEALGVGAFGVVCTAWDSRNQAWVAVKRATTPTHLPTHLVERSLMMEAYISTHLRHESECTQCVWNLDISAAV
jgi:hypothetical protein